MTTLQGSFLIAAPGLIDPNFYRSVVLMIQHDAEGALGLILNRPTETTVCEVWQQIAQRSCDRQDVIHVGGPVEGPLMALHTDENRSEREVLPGLHWSTQRPYLDGLVLDPTSQMRLYAGYAGWGSGQLEREIAEQSWLAVPAEVDLVFESGAEIHRLVTAHVQRSVLGLSEPPPLPPDIRMN